MKNALSLAAALFLCGCAQLNPAANEDMPLDKPLQPATNYTFAQWLKARPENLGPTLVILSFSGGGARAAAVASGVLDQLERAGLSNSIALISSTSGGSVTAAMYTAKGKLGLAELDGNFLEKDNMAALVPRLAPKLFIPGANRTRAFASYLDERLFPTQSPTYADLIKKWVVSPFVVLNATDMSSGRSFEFTQESFSELCSDLSHFPVMQAVAASAAFPFLLNPLPLKNHWELKDCAKYRSGESAEKLLLQAEAQKYLYPERLERARYAHSLEYSFAPSGSAGPTPDRKIEFVHLLDGGLSDNLAARAVLRVLAAHVSELQDRHVSNILLIQVNAKSLRSNSYDHTSALPSLTNVFWSVSLNPIDVATELSAYVSRLYLVTLVRATNLDKPPPRKIRVLPVAVDFNLLDDDRRRRAQAIGTNWSLGGKDQDDDLRFLKQVGRDLVTMNPCFNILVAQPQEPCEFIQLADSSATSEPPAGPAPQVAPAPVAVAPPVAAPAVVPVAPPAATKVTYAADAFFDFDKSVIKPEGKAKLDDLIGKIKDINLEVIIAVGHTDFVGSDSYNQKLSVRRSEAVKAYLVSKGIEKNRVYTEGKGEKQPVADNKTTGDRAKNRRVEIEVVGTRANR